MRRWLPGLLVALLVVAIGLSLQDTLEFYTFKAWIGLTQPSSTGANPLGQAVADVVLREYYDRIEAVAFYRNLAACADQQCLAGVLYDLDPHANLYKPQSNDNAQACSIPRQDRLEAVGPSLKAIPDQSSRPRVSALRPAKLGKSIYIRLRSFELDEGCFQQIWEVIRQANAPNSLIVDLRGNGGGYYEDAIALGSFFIPAGTALTTPLERYPRRYFDDYLRMPLLITPNGVSTRKGEVYPFTDNHPRKVNPKRIVILVDRDSASASEIFANLVRQYSKNQVLVAGDELSTGVGNTIMDTFSVGDYNLDLPTAILPGFGVYAQPTLSLGEATKLLNLAQFPPISAGP